MNAEIKHLIELVKANESKTVQMIVDEYFASITWSLLKAEYERMSAPEKRFLIAKLNTERK